MKVAVVTDSNSGITQAQAKEMGVYVLPMPFMIDGTEYLEDINLTQKEFYEHLSGDHDVSTSQPSPETILNLWEKLLEEYDAVVHIPMSSGLSSSCQTAKMLADDFDGKVQVADNHRISVTQRRSVQDALDMAAAGMDAEAICKKLEDTGLDSTIYVTVDTLKYLKKGGRITPAAAALGTLLRLKPVLTIQGEKLDSFSKARTMKQARTTMLAAVEDTDIPVVYSAVTDPAAAGFDGEENITGTSDALNTDAIMNLIVAANPGIDTIGLLYDLSQDASTQAIADAKAFCEKNGIKVVEKNGTTTAEVQMAAEALVAAGVKAVFTPTDNTIMTAELSIYESFIEAGVQHYTGADSFALNGALVGYGVDYVQLGEATADMVSQLLCDGKTPADLPYQTFDNGIVTINTETAEALGLDLVALKEAFKPYCTEITEVTTAENFS